jgi:hypothetical protein
MAIYNSTTKSTDLFNGYVPNILDNYDQVAYNITFFLMPENSVFNNDTSEGNRIIILETGKDSNFYIEDLEIQQVVSPTAGTRLSYATKFTFKVIEPGGVSLLDRIYTASINAGISNYLKVPYFIEIKFKGRNKDSSNPIGSNDASLGQLKWIFPITITQLETVVTSGGSEYDFTAAPSAELALTTQFGSNVSNISLTGRTVKDVFDNLSAILNKREENKLLAEHTHLDEYKFDIDPYFANMKISDESNINVQSQTMTKYDGSTDATIKEISIASNTPIPQIIDNILSSCREYQENAKNSISPENIKVKNYTNTKVIHRILTENQYISVDKNRGTYTNLYTYKIVPYEVGTVILDPKEIEANGKNLINEYKNKLILSKKYDYIFTGLNTQVINFDSKFTFTWHIPIPSIGGEQRTMDQINGAKAASIKEDSADIAQYKTIASKREMFKPSAIRYISDISTDSVLQYGANKNIPLSWIQSNSTQQNNFIESNNDPGKEYVNILYDQTFASLNNPNLVKIDIEIKGDPYWLGNPVGQSKDFRSVGFVNFDRSQVFFTLTMGVPREPDINTGLIKNIKKSLYSGVYQAITVTHKFVQGQFTQVLTAVKHPIIQSDDLENDQ